MIKPAKTQASSRAANAAPLSENPSNAVHSPVCLDAPHERVQVGDCQLAYRCYGQGPDLVFVHGWPLHAATFRHIVPHLSGQFRCHLFDLPGAGDSLPAPKAMIDLQAHVDTLQTALDRIGVTKYSLLAHDSGAVVARMLAARDARASALIIAGTEIPGHHPALLKFHVFLAKNGLGGLLGASLGLRAMRHSRLAFGACFHDLRLIDGEFHELFVAPLMQPRRRLKDTTGQLEKFSWQWVDELAQVHARIQVPTLLIWGEGDPYFPVEKARAMASQFGGPSEFVSLSNARLFVHEEHPHAFAEHALRFLQTHILAKAATRPATA